MPVSVQQQHLLQALSTATIRAISRQPSAQYKHNIIQINGRQYPILAPHLLFITNDNPNYIRGVADAIALRLRYSDLKLYQQQCPSNAIEYLLFEILEQLRVESLIPANMPGMHKNICYTFEHWRTIFRASGQVENKTGLILYTLINVTRLYITKQAIDDESQGLIESTREWLIPSLSQSLLVMKKNRNNQRIYATQALNIAHSVGQLIDIKNEIFSRYKQSKITDGNNQQETFSIILPDLNNNLNSDNANTIANTESNDLLSTEHQYFQYQIFTQNFDKEVHSHSLFNEKKRRELRKKLDKKICTQKVNIPRLAYRLFKILSTAGDYNWSYNHEEGIIDAKQLSQVVTTTHFKQIFKQLSPQPNNKTVVTFLIDNSGSMRQQHIEPVTLYVDIACRALDLAEVKTEILGFTTIDWNGGKARKKWLSQGSPKNPGRLNGLHHIIYKSADVSWKSAKVNIATLLQPSYFMESVDGEALQWAYQRLLNRNEDRRVLIIISDGSPMDTATLNANKNPQYLDSHLHQVINTIEQQQQVELHNIAVGLGMESFFQKTLSIDFSKPIDNTMLMTLVTLLAPSKQNNWT